MNYFYFLEFSDLPDLQADLILTIASLTVRNEYCLVVDEAGGLISVLDAMVKNYEGFGCELIISRKFSLKKYRIHKSKAGNFYLKRLNRKIIPYKIRFFEAGSILSTATYCVYCRKYPRFRCPSSAPGCYRSLVS